MASRSRRQSLATVDLPVLVIRGGASHPAVQRANALLAECLSGQLATIDGAAHFMIATHADEVADLICRHVRRAEAEPHWHASRGFRQERPAIISSGAALPAGQ